MAAVVLELKDMPQWIDTTLSAAIREGARKGLYSAALRMVNEIKLRTIPAAVPEPTDRGLYKAGWRAEQTDDGAAYYNPLPHAPIIEHGARAANIKVGSRMISMLAEWVQRKGIAKDSKQARRLAWAIARSMAASVTIKGQQQKGGNKGIFKGSGLKIMERANKQLATFLEEEVSREIERAITGGG